MTNKLHIIYTSIIFVIIIIFLIIILTKGVICDAAYTNVSFAATISSIVLAVVSITVSISSAQGISANLGEMAKIEQRLAENIEHTKFIEHKVDASNKLIAQLTKNGEKEDGAYDTERNEANNNESI